MKALLVAFAAVALLCAFAVAPTSAALAICQVGQTPNTLCLCENNAATQGKCSAVSPV